METELDPEALMAQAAAAADLSHWGGRRFVDGLAAFCEAVNRDSELSPAGRQAARDQVLRLLGERLRLYRDRADHPGIAAETIRRPIILTGLPRTGSTLLHGMLARDPRARSISTWEHQQLSPPPRAETYHTDPRIARSRAALSAVTPDALRIHSVGATLPDECNFVTALAFQSINLHSRQYWSSYVDWYLAADDAAPFELHRHVLQHLQCFCRRDWWVLKSPPHIFHLDRIFATYPDARVVFLHRDPGVAIPSIADLFAGGRRKAYADFDSRRAGRDSLRWWRAGIDRALASRARDGRPGRYFDVSYDAFVAAPMPTVRAIYDWLGEDLPRDAAAPMERFLSDNPKGKFGAHRYTAEAHGLDASAIRRDWSDYIEAFDVPVG